MKKWMITILAIALMVTAANPVLAADGEENKSGLAGISFDDGEAPGIVTPGPDSKIYGPSLNFGLRELSTSNETYFSTDGAEGIEEDDEYAGVLVSNPYRNYTWEVNVSIGNFTNGETVTLENYELTLHLDLVDYDSLAEPAVKETVILTAGSSDKIMTPKAGATAGSFGANYYGQLDVAAGSAHIGDASATMLWAFQIVI